MILFAGLGNVVKFPIQLVLFEELTTERQFWSKYIKTIHAPNRVHFTVLEISGRPVVRDNQKVYPATNF